MFFMRTVPYTTLRYIELSDFLCYLLGYIDDGWWCLLIVGFFFIKYVLINLIDDKPALV